MRLASFEHAGVTTWGVIDGSEAIDVGAVLGAEYPTLRTAIAADATGRISAVLADVPRFSVDDITWLPVIPDPTKILCIGLNYEMHRVETGRDVTGHPAVFTRFADSQIGHKAPIVRPHMSTELDYEGELAIVIGKGGRYISRDQAMDHVAGYSIYNDGSVRDWQRHTIQFTPGKNFPGTGALGPVLVTSDEITDYRELKLETRVNGEVLQSAGLDQLIFSIPVLIEYCSTFTPLNPGDVIATGTPGGVGAKRKPPVWLKPGDKVEIEVSQIGILQNEVEDER
ncbi:fumarylacetoacetate hydrolase family protein [Novosphingobium sp. RL4]|uniref:fumarylacetoacetate hydrolase family protein n=1 Tax=Novosphingobium sp. RL4 TaxID=3109595 RepID=UPI002D76A699|nr:fumarylacetoacetate hydrolase family protein [Novosphingobium sp. RL4]WRT94428.1 fumarylacetoacetate hydrolase family protein [Novosphingobium sp. RL4]